MNRQGLIARAQRGVTMIEVLVTMLILSFGMLGLAGLQMKVQLAEMESYQRAQAVILVSDMIERITANRTTTAGAASYITTSPLGVGDSEPASCTGVAMGAARDKCEWSNALKGAAEKSGSSDVGAMIGGRGCVERVQDEIAATCRPAIYQVTVAWQGFNATAAPKLTCGTGSYGNENLRRAIAAKTTVGLARCAL